MSSYSSAPYIAQEALGKLNEKTICSNCEYVTDNKRSESSRPCGKELCQKALDGVAMEENL